MKRVAILTATTMLGLIPWSFLHGQEQSTNADPSAWVEQRIKLWQPVAAERRFDEIGWAKDILEARRLATKHNRPIFLFTHDGHMAVGRC